MNGSVFDIQRFSVHDGPGIRTTVFVKGCPLRCLWCHNPESQSPKPQLMFYKDKCVGCGKCAAVCNKTFSPACAACGECVKVCDRKAREISGYQIDSGEIIGRVLRDREYYITSGGGVTVSGGEPLMQAEFTLEIIKGCKENGINTAIETSGFGDREKLASLMPYTDLFLYDVKGTDPVLHKKNTGVGNEIILANADYLRKNGANVLFRMPYIPGFNDSELPAVREFAGDTPLELMPYHVYGEGKYASLGREYAPAGTAAPSRAEMLALGEKYGCRVSL